MSRAQSSDFGLGRGVPGVDQGVEMGKEYLNVDMIHDEKKIHQLRLNKDRR